MNIKNLMYAALFCFIILSCSGQVMKQKKQIFKHAHNDYEHNKPLFDALNEEFNSVEADVFIVGDSLFVAHNKPDIKEGRTLRQLYLNPLKDLVAKNNGSVHGDGKELLLFIDIKTEGLSTYKKLHTILADYKDVITGFNGQEEDTKAIRVIVSGERPIEFMQKQVQRFAGFDGRIDNLDSDFTPELMPVVSDNWKKYFTWDGTGKMPEQEKVLLKSFVEKAHKKGYLLRFWGTPNQTAQQREAIWSELIHAGVDIIGTDHLKDLNEFVTVSNNQ